MAKKKFLLLSMIILAGLTIINYWISLPNKPIRPSAKKIPIPKYVFQISEGSPWGKLLLPQQILPFKNRLIISDTGNSRILAFDTKGKYVLEFEKVTKNKINPNPYGLAADNKGNIYVVDTELGQILIYNEQGRFLRFFNIESQYIAKPTGIYIQDDRIYISDVKLQQVHVFNREGKLLLTLGSGKPGNTEKDFRFPNTVVADKKGNIYVTDNLNNRIQLFDRNGKYLKTLGVGKGITLTNPRGIALDSEGNVYIANTLNASIKVLDKEGNFLYDMTGENSYNFTLPSSISIDGKNNIYVTDRAVLVFRKTK